MAFSAKRNNYTAVLERVYGISEGRIIHIHGSLRDHECDPVLGHGNIERIEQIDERLEEAGRMYDEKEISICKVIRDYYESTYKDANRKLSRVSNKNIDEIYVIGHSVAEVDLPYFRYIENCTHRQSNWIVYFFNKEEKDRIYKNLMDSGIQKFYNL